MPDKTWQKDVFIWKKCLFKVEWVLCIDFLVDSLSHVVFGIYQKKKEEIK